MAGPGGGRPLRAVLFDAAGTLIELREPLGETYARFARAHGARLDPARIEDAFERVFRAAAPMVFPDAGPGDAGRREREWWRRVVAEVLRRADPDAPLRDADGCFDALWSHYAGAGAWRARPGARETLQALRARGRLTAVVSNFDRRLPALLEALDLAAALDSVVLPSDAGAAKPDPRIFAFALARLGVPAAAAVYVGDDRAHDVEGARGAGLRAVDVADLANLRELILQLAPEELPQ